jgi:SAM-dependent methyltransferase
MSTANADKAANADQAEAWNGPEGVHWAGHRDRIDDGSTPLHEHLFAASAIAAGDHVLDIGCGTGTTTRLAARRAVGGLANGVDLSAPMLSRARAVAAAEGVPNVKFYQGDVQVYPFPGAWYDVAISQFGVMFFADPVAAFANVGRALRPGGRLVFVGPRDMRLCKWYMVPMTALLGHRPLQTAGGMFSLADPVHIHDVLGGAGFRDVVTTPIDVPMAFGADVAEAVEFYLGTGPVLGFLKDHPQVSEDRARDILAAALRRHESADGVWLDGAHWLVTAVWP